MVSGTSIPVTGTGIRTQLYCTERNGCAWISVTMEPVPIKGYIVNGGFSPGVQDQQTRNAITANIRFLSFIRLHLKYDSVNNLCPKEKKKLCKDRYGKVPIPADQTNGDGSIYFLP